MHNMHDHGRCSFETGKEKDAACLSVDMSKDHKLTQAWVAAMPEVKCCAWHTACQGFQGRLRSQLVISAACLRISAYAGNCTLHLPPSRLCSAK
jgi:hypothetical protein